MSASRRAAQLRVLHLRGQICSWTFHCAVLSSVLTVGTHSPLDGLQGEDRIPRRSTPTITATIADARVQENLSSEPCWRRPWRAP